MSNVNQTLLPGQSGIAEQEMYMDQQSRNRMHPMINPGYPSQNYGRVPYPADFRYVQNPPSNNAPAQPYFPPEFQQPNMIGLLNRCSDEFNQGQKQKVEEWRIETVRHS